MGLLIKAILIILLFYYAFKILARFFGPSMLKYFTKKATERFSGQFRDFQNKNQQQPIRKEGEISIDKMPENKTSNKTVGEYVDYEEID